MIRENERWYTLDWEAALDLCAEKIQSYRQVPAAILHVKGDGAKGVLKQAGSMLFSRLGTSRTKGCLCDPAGLAAYDLDFGSRLNNDPLDLLNARQIVNWGKDLSRSSIHMAALVRRACKKGCRVLSISPGGDGAGKFADDHICIRPGTDRFLAAAVLRRLLEHKRLSNDVLSHIHQWAAFRDLLQADSTEHYRRKCEVSNDDLDLLCDRYARSDPVATIIGAGLQRHLYGGENVRFINALALMTGHIGRRGGGSFYHLRSMANLNLDWIDSADQTGRRSFYKGTIGQSLLAASDPPVRMLWVNGINILNQAPDCRTTQAAFDMVDFTVVVDAFMTDTARKANLVLPPALMLEQEDLVGSFLHHYVHYVPAVMDPPGQARDDYKIVTELGRRLDPPVILPPASECFERALDSPVLDTCLKDLKQHRFIRAKQPLVAYQGLVSGHADSLFRLPLELHDEPPPPEAFPLRLLSLVRRNQIHSQILPEDQDGELTIWISPQSPHREGFDRREAVWLVSEKGRMRARLEFSKGLHPRTLLCRRGGWLSRGEGVNQLVPGRITDIGGGTAFYQTHVRIEKM
jgi:anaerobic selenocysteine-containing dehydrogenase